MLPAHKNLVRRICYNGTCLLLSGIKERTEAYALPRNDILYVG